MAAPTFSTTNENNAKYDPTPSINGRKMVKVPHHEVMEMFNKADKLDKKSFVLLMEDELTSHNLYYKKDNKTIQNAAEDSKTKNS